MLKKEKKKVNHLPFNSDHTITPHATQTKCRLTSISLSSSSHSHQICGCARAHTRAGHRGPPVLRRRRHHASRQCRCSIDDFCFHQPIVIKSTWPADCPSWLVLKCAHNVECFNVKPYCASTAFKCTGNKVGESSTGQYYQSQKVSIL